MLESLESRLLLTAVSWISPVDGFWDVATNWSPPQVPGSGDDVILDLGGLNPTIEVRDSRTVNSLISRESLHVTAGTLTVNAASQIDNSSLMLAGGNLAASGPTTVSASGAIQWQSGTISGNGLTNNGTIALSTSGAKQLDGILSNAGLMILQDAATLGINDCCGIALDIQSGGTFDIQSDADTSGGIISVRPGGTLKKSGGIGGADESRLASRVNLLGGTVEVTMGKLTLAGAGAVSSGGTLNVSPGAVLDLTGGANGVSYGGAYTGSGGGLVLLSGGRLDTPSSGATFNLPANMLHWTGGQIFGPGIGFVNDGSLTLSGVADKLLTGRLANNGTIAHTSTGDLLLDGSSLVANNAGGVYDFADDGDFGSSGGGAGFAPYFQNDGTIRKSAGTGTTSELNLPVNTTATAVFAAQVGRLKLNAGGLWQGATMNAAAGAVLEISNSASVTGAFAGAGEGRVELSGGNISSSDFGVAGAHATFNFPNGLFHWTGGGISSGGCGSDGGCGTTLVNAGFITIEGAASKGIGGTGLMNTGTIVNAGPGDFGLGGATFDNRFGATYEHRGDSNLFGTDQFGNPGRFINAGTFAKSAGNGTVDVTARLENSTTGLIDVQSGRLKFSRGGNSTGGTFNAAAGAVLDFAGNDGFNMLGGYSGGGLGRFEANAQFFANDPTGTVFNFPDGFFHWVSREWFGTFINAGSVTLSGAAGRFARAKIVNDGTFVHLDDGNLFLNPDAVFENKGLYEFRSDADIVVPNSASGGTMMFLNTGTLRKSNGLGASELRLDARHPCNCQDLRLSNTGTIEVMSGSIVIDRPIAQATGSTLTDGTWIVGPFSTLSLRNSLDAANPDLPTPNFTLNQGHVTLQGPASNFPNINTLAENRGSFSILDGRDFTTVGNLTNTGTITAGTGSTLSVSGDYKSTHLVGWWRGEGNATDSADGLNGVRSGSVSFAPGQFGQAFQFPDFNGQIDLGNPPELQFQNLTISAWVKQAVESVDPDTGQVSFFGGTIFSGGSYDFFVTSSGQLRICGPSNCANSGTLLIPDANFHQVAITKNGTQVQFYVDGVASTVKSLFGTFTFTNDARIGPLPGSLDEVAIYNRALTTAEIQSLSDVNHIPGVGRQSPRLQFEIGGTPASGLFGQVDVTGKADTTGAMQVKLVNGYGPIQGDKYTILDYASRRGAQPVIGGLNPFFTAAVQPTKIELNTVASAASIKVDSVTPPVNGTVGQDVTIQYTVRNLDNVAITGDWTDSIYLSRDITFGTDDLLIARVPHNGGLAALGSYNGSITSPLPAVRDGNYHVIVIADSRGQVPDLNRADNTLASSGVIQVQVPLLTLGTTTNGTITNGQDRYYRLDVPAGGDVLFTTNFSAMNQAEFFVRYRDMPTRSTYDFVANDPTQLMRTITLASPQAGPYYVLLHGREGAGGQGFDITPEHLSLAINNVSPSRGANVGTVTTTIRGAGFTPGTEVHLMQGVNSERQAVVQFADANTLFATFNLVGLAAGAYDVRVNDVAGSDTAASTFTVTTGQPGHLEFHISGPGSLRAGRAQTVYIDYENTGETDIPARVFTLFADNAVLRLPEHSQFRGSVIDLLGINAQGPAGVLPPGARGTIPVVFLPAGSTSFEVQVNNQADVLDWNALEEPLRPADVPADAWSAIFENFKSQVGATTGQLEAVLRDNANRLSQMGIYTHDVSRLLAFEFDQANDFGAIAARYEFGIFGRGQPSLFETAAVTAANGDVTLVTGSVFRRFSRQSNGSYLAAPGDASVLTRLPTGEYRLREATGITQGFLADGKFHFVEAPSGDRITATYSAGRLASLADTLGNSMLLSYDGHGKVSQITDAVGRVTQFTYDGSAQHLVQIVSAEGTTTIGYVTGQGEPREHAVSSIAFPNGTHAFFQYDSQGRLTLQSRDGNAEPLSFAYDTTGGVASTNALMQSAEFWRNDYGEIGRFINPLDQVLAFTFDAARNLNRQASPLGGQVTLTHDARGNVQGMSLPEGQQLDFNYDSVFSQLQTVRDARGNTTAYEVDANANLVRITNADASEATFAYNAVGQLTEAVNRRGQSIRYTYNANHLLSRKELPGGEQIDYTYDAHRNLATLTDASGTTTFEYDAADRLTKVTYANGRFLSYSYNGLGQRTGMEDQDGFVVNYTYDALGRLASVSHGMSTPVVEYVYNAAGRLARANLGNGAFTTYEYDDAGRVTGVVNHRNSMTELSHYNYTLDASGRPLSLDSPEGTRTFEYDLNLQLAAVELPGGRAIAYEYDAAGNRIAVTDDGQTTAYAANSLNQYTTVGAAVYTYDADGNLASRTDGSGTTTYEYNAENRLVSAAAPGHAWNYEYDALGNLVAVVHNGQRTEYLVDPTGLANIVGEYTGGGALVANNVYGLGLAGRVDDIGSANFYHYDATGNTVQITDPAGNTLNQYNYLPFGEQVTAVEGVPNPFTVNGRFGVVAPGDGLHHMRQRTYDPALGRFAQADPLNIFGGDANLYRFALNDPLSFVDPAGLQSSTPSTAEKDAQAAVNALDKLKGSSGETLKNAKSLVNAGSKAPGLAAGVVTGGAGVAVLATYGGSVLMAGSLAEFTGGALVLTTGAAAGLLLTGGGLLLLGGGILAYTFSDGFGLTTPVENVLSDNVQTNQCLFLMAQQRTGHLPPYSPAEIADAARACRDGMFPGPVHRSQEQKSNDPNEIIGPARFVLPDQTLPYTIRFENLATATAPAQDVMITHQLDGDVDFGSFVLGDFGFGDTVIDVPDGRSFYQTQVSLAAAPEIGGEPLIVDVTAGINLLTGLVTWTFRSLDPTTGDLTSNALAGFLPPNVTSPNGQGFVNYTVRSKPGLTTGTRIDALATIVFDTNAPLDTSAIFSTIDSEAPTSSVNALPVTTYTKQFNVSWAGADEPNGSGLATFDVFVSTDGGPFVPWVTNTTATSRPFDLPRQHTYAFYALAQDNVGHQTLPPATFDTQTFFLGPPWQNPINPLDVDRVDGVVSRDALIVINELNDRTVSADDGALPLVTQQLEFPSFDVNGDNFVVSLDALLVINFINGLSGEGETTAATPPLTTPASDSVAWLTTPADPSVFERDRNEDMKRSSPAEMVLADLTNRRDLSQNQRATVLMYAVSGAPDRAVGPLRRVGQIPRAIQTQPCDALFAEFDEPEKVVSGSGRRFALQGEGDFPTSRFSDRQ